MATKYKLSYTAADIDEKLGKVNTLPTSQDVKIANANTLSKARLYHNRQQSVGMKTDEWRNIMSDMALLKLQMAMLKYDLSYYSSMVGAVADVNAGTIGTNADATKENAVAGVYTDDNGGVNVVLLKDTTESTRIKTDTDMTINLGGNTLSANDKVVIQPQAGVLFIDGRLDGSSIVLDSDNATKVLQCAYDSITIVKGGTYTLSSAWADANADCIVTLHSAQLTIEDAIINSSSAAYGARAIVVNSGTSATILNCKLYAIASNGKTVGISNVGSTTTYNSEICAYSNYLYGDDTDYAASSTGIVSEGTLTINDCYVIGTHSGLCNYGTLVVNGGTYEGYGHGGIYFSGIDSTSYVRDAIIRDCDMPEGYTATSNRNGAGMYISGTNSANQTVYMDSCDIYGSAQHQTIAIASSYGAQNNSLYISNSTINNLNGGVGHVRIDDVTHKLYIGSGNNFIIDNVSLGEAVVETDEVYVQS